jgi:hypothetical protein
LNPDRDDNGRASDCGATDAFHSDDDFNDPESNYLMPETWAKMGSGRPWIPAQVAKEPGRIEQCGGNTAS